MPLFARWRAERDLKRKTDRYVGVLTGEPAESDVEWLAATAARGDADHAAWELRYARRALGLLVAERDALDDRTASLVARALNDALARDQQVAAAMLEVAERQFNARLSAYRDVLAARAGSATPGRLGQTLFAFSGGAFREVDANVGRAGELLAGYLGEASAALRDVYGAAALPEHLPPSALAKR